MKNDMAKHANEENPWAQVPLAVAIAEETVQDALDSNPCFACREANLFAPTPGVLPYDVFRMRIRRLVGAR